MQKIILMTLVASIGLIGCATTNTTKPSVQKTTTTQKSATPAAVADECQEGDDLCDTGGTRGVNE